MLLSAVLVLAAPLPPPAAPDLAADLQHRAPCRGSSGRGAYGAEADRGVKSFRLLLPERALRGTNSLEVLFNGRRLRPRPKPSAEVLLVEFAERFDRRFLPVAEVVVK